MRNLTLIAFFSVLLFGFAGVNAQQVAHVNSIAIFESMPDYQAAQTKLKNEADRHKAEVERQTKEMQDMYAQAQADMEKVKDGTDAEKQAMYKKLAPIEQELQMKQKALTEYQQNAAQQYNKLEQDLLGPIYKQVQDAINAVGKAKKIGYIIDLAEAGPRGIIVFYENGMDLDADVKKQLGL